MKAGGVRLAQRARATQALAMRADGATFADIANSVGYASPSGAYKAVMKALTDVDQELSSQLRQLQLARLDTLLAEVWPIATDGQHPRQIRAVDQLLAIMHRIDVLTGLDS